MCCLSRVETEILEGVRIEGEHEKMKAELKHYKVAYNRLYGFLRSRHPEILEEYRKLMEEAKNKALLNFELSMLQGKLIVSSEQSEKT
jgi:hypothetical protein